MTEGGDERKRKRRRKGGEPADDAPSSPVPPGGMAAAAEGARRRKGGGRRRRRLLLAGGALALLVGGGVALGVYLRSEGDSGLWKLHDQAAAAYAAGDFEAAVAMNRRILETRPKDIVARFNLGAALLRLERDEEAWEHITWVAEQDEHHAAAQMALARRAVEEGREDEAVRRLRRVVARPPVPFGAHALLARVLRRRGDVAEALPSLEAVVADEAAPLELRVASAVRLGRLHAARAEFLLDAGPARLASQGAYKLAGDLARRLLERGGADAAAAHGHLARIELALGRPEQALASCDLAVEAAVDPAARAGLRTIRAQIYATLGSEDEARQELAAALSETEKPAAEAFAAAADFHLSRDEPAAALDILAQGIAAHPVDEELALAYARRLFLSGRPDDAIAEARRLAEAVPDSLRALLRVAAFQRLRGEVSAARATYETARERAPDDPIVRIRIADCAFAEAGETEELDATRLDEARSLAEAVLADEPGSVDARIVLAKVLLARPGERRRKAYDQAAELLRAAIERDPFALEAHTFLAWADFLRGRPGEAVLGLERVLGRLPDERPRLRLLLARALLTAGDPLRAVVQARRGLEGLPDDEGGLRTLVDALRATDQPAAALEALGELARVAPDDVTYPLLMAQIHAAQRDVTAAEERFARAEEVAAGLEDPDASLDAQVLVAQARAAFYQQLGDADAAKGAFATLLDRTGGSPEGHVRYGRFLLALGQEDEAEREFKQAIAKDTGSIAARRALADLYFGRKQVTDELRQLVATVERISPGAAEVDYLRGKLAFLDGDLKVAADLLQRFAEVRPDDADGHFAAAVVLTRAARFEDAVRHMERAQELRPESLQVRVALAKTRFAWGESLMRRGRFREAQGALAEAVRDDGGSEEPRQLLAKSLALTGNVDLSEREIRLLLRQDPDDPVARRMLAGVHLVRQDYDAAAAELEHVVRVHPEEWSTWVMLATVNLARARPDDALDAARKAREAAPDEPLSMAGVVQVLMETGRIPQARQELAALLQARPDVAYFHYLTALLDVREDKAADAVGRLEAALEREPGMAVALRLAVGLLVARLQDEPRALEIARARAARAPESLEMRHVHAALEWRAGDPDAARAALAELAEHEPPFLPSVTLLASIEASRKEYVRARDVLVRAIEAFPEAPDLRYLLGENYVRDGLQDDGGVAASQRGLALAAFREADSLRPRHAPTLNMLAYLLALDASGLEEALQHSEAAVQIAPGYVPYMDTLGRVLLALERPERAAEVLRQALGRLADTERELRQAEAARREDPRVLAARRTSYERTASEVRAHYDQALEAAQK